MNRSDLWPALAVLLLLAVLLAALARGYRVYEDGLVENLQALFLAASAVTAVVRGLGVAVPRLRAVYLGAALVVAWVFLEEVSYGQRLLGFATPAFFAARNVQGEVNLHNFANGAVEWTFAAAVVLLAGVVTVGRRTRLARWLPLPRFPKLLLVVGYLGLWGGTKLSAGGIPLFARITRGDLDEAFELGLYWLVWLLLLQPPDRLWFTPAGRRGGGARGRD